MRELDRNEIYFDDVGRPLVGRVLFYQKGTTTLAAVYGMDKVSGEFVELSNPMYTANGRLSPQVFLDDFDYSIEWQMYVGTTSMINDAKASSWLTVGSCVSLAPTVHLSADIKGVPSVANIAALKALDASMIGESGTVTLLGYYEPGDKPSVNYVWDESSTEADDGCTVIQLDGSEQGRFKISVFGEIDIRHFGVFPKITPQQTTGEDALRIQIAHRYAVANSSYISFADGGDIAYYRFATEDYWRFIFTGENVRIIAGGSDNVHITLRDGNFVKIASPEGLQGNFSVYAKELRSSCNVDDSTKIKLYPTDTLIIDSAKQSALDETYEDLEIIFETAATRNFIFRRCRVTDGVTTSYVDGSFKVSFGDKKLNFVGQGGGTEIGITGIVTGGDIEASKISGTKISASSGFAFEKNDVSAHIDKEGIRFVYDSQVTARLNKYGLTAAKISGNYTVKNYFLLSNGYDLTTMNAEVGDVIHILNNVVTTDYYSGVWINKYVNGATTFYTVCKIRYRNIASFVCTAKYDNSTAWNPLGFDAVTYDAQ